MERPADNRLAEATSDYLRLHADNPVDWREWGDDAFAEARERGVPVFASVGYATCHWCHVMARESFADPAVGALLRDGFVAVKVDREERPDVDAALMGAASAFTRQLGWPLSVFLTPDGLPFYAGTYFPPAARQGIPGFRDVLGAIGEAWRTQPDAVVGTAEQVQQALRESAAVDGDAPDAAAARAALAAVARAEDPEHGGLGTGQKFPQAPLLLALVDVDPQLAGRLLDAAAGDDAVVAAGGYSHLRGRDGGFFRYATQRDWSVPHFERMLVDNAQLLHVATLLGRESVASGLVGFLGDVLRLPGGAFAVAEDAESTVDGRRVEGGWHLAPAEAGVERPPLDRLVVTAANGLAIEALAVRALRDGDRAALELARGAAEHLLAHHAADPAALVHASLDGQPSAARATAADAGCLASGLLALTAATGEARWAIAARAILDAAPDPAATSAQGPALQLGPDADGDAPSGQAALAGALHALFALSGDADHLDRAARLLDARLAIRNPIAGPAMLRVAARIAEPPRTLVLIGDPPEELRREPGAFVATPEQAAELAAAGFALLEGKTAPAAYRCEGFVCELPQPY
ncbi:thioredoxin domain-containing protein [Agrococcus jenensis]|uniref:Spermatogenesis-associated protein 20-like TRX domain-containing protein n=1 Tax=Agrococcus jenensis TaxID=46353 RepID=A0A3N2ATM2_9MICO|nr:DUF255 domain-containing protein [Agrococcus jenensis]ROR66285.1 hypothetical protein EDD26_1667 [Agrococcus jenensis]